jgi:hypothetical protein
MIRALAFSLLLFAGAHAGAATALVQSKQCRPSAGTSQACTFDAAATPGNTIVATAMVLSTSVTVSGVSDGTNSYSAALSNVVMSHAGVGDDSARGHFYYALSSGTPSTVTFTLSGTPSDDTYIVLYELSGVRSSGALDQAVNSGAGDHSTTPSIEFTTDFADEFAIAMFGGSNTEAFTAGSGWTTTFDDAGAATFLHRVLTTAGSFTADGTYTDAKSWNVAVVTFRGLAAGGGEAGPVITLQNPMKTVGPHKSQQLGGMLD